MISCRKKQCRMISGNKGTFLKPLKWLNPHHIVGTLRDLCFLESLITCSVWKNLRIHSFCKHSIAEVHKKGIEFVFCHTAILSNILFSNYTLDKFHLLTLLWFSIGCVVYTVMFPAHAPSELEDLFYSCWLCFDCFQLPDIPIFALNWRQSIHPWPHSVSGENLHSMNDWGR